MGSVFLFLFCPLFSECGGGTGWVCMLFVVTLLKIVKIGVLWLAQTRFCVLGFHLRGSWSRQILFTTVTSTSTWDVNALIITSAKLLVWWNNGKFHCSLQEFCFTAPRFRVYPIEPTTTSCKASIHESPTPWGAGFYCIRFYICDLREHRGSKARKCNLVTLVNWNAHGDTANLQCL